MSNYIRINIPGVSPEKQEWLIALLENGGFEGFEQTEDAEAELRAFIPAEKLDPSWLDALANTYQFRYTRELIPEQNWNAIWESGFQPVQVDDFAGIRAAFHPPMSGVTHEIVITPKMSFGTGHHATTYMMLAAMQQLDCRHKTVFDFGTGTGILAILAEKLGAASVLAIDNDAWSIENAAENLLGNQCRKVQLEKADRVPVSQTFDIILANINRNIILANMDALAGALASGGTLLLSGLLEEDEADICAAAASRRLILADKMGKNNWICLRFNH